MHSTITRCIIPPPPIRRSVLSRLLPASFSSNTGGTSSTSTTLRKFAAPYKSMRKPIRTIALYCWILEVSKRVLAVKIKDNKTVYELKEAIFKKGSNTLAGIDVFQLGLWKVSIAINEKLEDEVTKREYADADGLMELHTLSNVFPPPEPAQETVHIVVKVLPARSFLHNRKRDHEGGDRPQVEILKREFGKSAPSSLAHPEVFRKFSGPGHAVARNRPFELNTIPLVLLHEAFAIFKDRCQVEPSEKALVCLIGI